LQCNGIILTQTDVQSGLGHSILLRFGVMARIPLQPRAWTLLPLARRGLLT
jgi:hypothetical protein